MWQNIEFKRRHWPEMLYETDWLIEQQIARYFSRLSAVTKIGYWRGPLCKYEWGRRGRCRWSSYRSRNWPNKAKDKEGPGKISTAGESTDAIKLKKNKDLCISLFFHIYRLWSRNNWLCPGIFSSREICRKPTGQNTAGLFLREDVSIYPTNLKYCGKSPKICFLSYFHIL